MHAVTKEDSYDSSESTEKSAKFVFHQCYDSEIFQGILPDPGAAVVSTAGQNQVIMLRKVMSITI
ncbi:hypothetical protein GcM3_135016 [Golovinomyces cichoracearum]|uniref:Uncharacterized protein n=1 Tax=Golovinomyces cichoracearum TaxID=62708 RepID=A0A420I2Z0_9PEZI|nr:hypothetical protein GcM3_135016 [Golovinomyces cichoracearum]